MTNTHIHYAKNIDIINIGDDFGEDGAGWGSIYPTLQTYGLMMLLQSRPETRRIIHDGNTSFVGRERFYHGETPKTYTSADPVHIIVINPVPTLDEKAKQALSDKACEQVNPEKFKAEQARLNELRALDLEAQARVEEKRQEMASAMKTGGDRDALVDEFYELKNTEDNRILSYRHDANHIIRQRERDYGRTEYCAALRAQEISWRAQQAEPIATLLREGGIEFRGPTGEDSLIEIDQNQTDFDAKLSALMDTHREKILEQYKDVNFIIPKPDGTALDKEQAAAVITKRQAALAEDAAALDAAAEKYGVTNIVLASRPKTGGWARAAGSDPASGD